MDPITIALGLAQLAPMVAGWFAGPKAEQNAQKAVDIAMSITGKPANEVIDALKADPALVLQYQRAVGEQHMTIFTAVLSDIANARAREATVGGFANPVLAAVIVGGFLGMVFMILDGHVEGLKDPLTAALVGTMIGYVSAKADQVVAYYFGSTAKSAQKDTTITNLAAR